MRTPPRWVLVATVLVAAAAGSIRAQALEVAGHAGTRDDGKALLGGQIGVSLAHDWAAVLGVTNVRGLGPSGSFTLVEAVGRWTAAESGAFRFYGLAGAAMAFVEAGDVVFSDLGALAGAGMGVTAGKVEPFVEARVFRDGSTSGLFWAGLRIRTGGAVSRR